MTELENTHSLIERMEGKKLMNEGIDIDYISHLVSFDILPRINSWDS
jgi:hypothetical protein